MAVRGSPSLGILLARGPSAPEAEWATSLARAAAKRGIGVELFLTADGVELIGSPRFPALEHPRIRVRACTRSVTERGVGTGVVGVDYTNQFELGRVVARVDRFVSFT